MSTPSEGRMTYDAIAEELSAPGVTLADLDPAYVKLAREYAKRSHQKWPPRQQASGWQMHIHSM